MVTARVGLVFPLDLDTELGSIMQTTLRRICELQKHYSSKNTPSMKERGLLIRTSLRDEIQSIQASLEFELGDFGSDLHVEGSDGLGMKTHHPWVRFCSKRMSPRPTDGFYAVVHFSADGSAVHIAVGCGSSKFHEGNSIVRSDSEIDARVSWARRMVIEERGDLEPFTDVADFGAALKLTRSFERACAFVRKIQYDDIEDSIVEKYLIEAAKVLRVVYQAQHEGRELSQSAQAEIGIDDLLRPVPKSSSRGQGYGLDPDQRKAVELRAMTLSIAWLKAEGYTVKDTSATKPYDLEASKDGSPLYVEVKGTTADVFDSVHMTHGEVALHTEKQGQTALLLVSGVRIVPISSPVAASGGTLEPLVGWDISEWGQKPVAFRVSRESGQAT